MIDKLVLRCPFKKVMNPVSLTGFSFPQMALIDLGVPHQQSIDRNGNTTALFHRWESIPSSFDSMGFKVFDHRHDSLDSFYVEINASPAKIMLGHNVFGSSDIYDCAYHLIDLLRVAYPQLFQHLDTELWSLHQIDITYSSRAKDVNESKLFVNALHCVSYGQTKARTGYDGTAYFGKKNSKLKKIKVYSKYPELLETMKSLKRQPDGELLVDEVYTSELQEFTKGLIRIESSLYERWFERNGISNLLTDIFKEHTFTEDKQKDYWLKANSNLFKALEGQTMTMLEDSEIKLALRSQLGKVSAKTGKLSTVLADSVYRTYLLRHQARWLRGFF